MNVSSRITCLQRMWNDQIDIYKHITMKHIPEVGPSTGFCKGFVRGGARPQGFEKGVRAYTISRGFVGRFLICVTIKRHSLKKGNSFGGSVLKGEGSMEHP